MRKRVMRANINSLKIFETWRNRGRANEAARIENRHQIIELFLFLYQDRNESAGGKDTGKKLLLPGFPLPEPPVAVREIPNEERKYQSILSNCMYYL